MTRVKIPDHLRRLVLERARRICEYCCSLADYSSAPFPIDHVIPRAKDGATQSDNLALSCGGCNGAKLDRTEAIDPVTRETVAIYNPRIQRWQGHFEWSEDYRFVIGITAVGRGTIVLLDMNREGLLNLREVLVLAGLHPPTME